MPTEIGRETPAPEVDGVQTSPDTKPAGTPDWGDINRELLAERLRKAFHTLNSQDWYYNAYIATLPIEERWTRVADEAIEALLGES